VPSARYGPISPFGAAAITIMPVRQGVPNGGYVRILRVF
jgi:hypothetical protein